LKGNEILFVTHNRCWICCCIILRKHGISGFYGASTGDHIWCL
jgi:hypothetical protein